MSSDDEYFQSIPKKAFDIGKVPDDMDISQPPSSGVEYLRHVKYEFLRCPKVVSADIDTKKFIHKQTVNVDACNGSVPAPPGYAPSTKWQKQQVQNFSKLRLKLFAQKSQFKKRKGDIALPNMQDRNSWFIFCLGHDYTSRTKDSTVVFDDSLSKSYPPLVSILVRLIQPDIETLLSHHITWLKEFGFSHHQGRWVFALLSCLEKPLTPNACYLLRNLVRTCTDLRSNLPNREDDFLKPLNLLICLVAYYFDQKDMGDAKQSESEPESDEEFDFIDEDEEDREDSSN